MFRILLAAALLFTVPASDGADSGQDLHDRVLADRRSPRAERHAPGLPGWVEGGGLHRGQDLRFEYENAQGDVGNARNIAEKFLADGVDLLAPCTTPNTLATIRVAKGSKTPVVFGCVTNPVEVGVIASLDKPTGTNVTGLYGAQPVAELLDLVQEILPKAKTIGTIFNGGKSNSTAADAIAKAYAEQHGIKWVEVQITSSAEVKTAVDSLVGRVDALVTPQDNTLASAYDAVVKATRDAHLPLFSLDTTAVQRGALAAYGVDQYKSGVAWATLVAVPVLLGKDPPRSCPCPTAPTIFT